MKSNSLLNFFIQTPLFPLKATLLDNEFLISLEFYFEKIERSPILPSLAKEVDFQIKSYFNRRLKKFDIPYLFIKGTPFQQSCWQVLSEIPYGETISYQEEALRVDNSKAVRAVGGANGKNPLSIVIPCHRVIAKNGKLGGYTTKAGLNTNIKEYLLSLEK